MAAAAPWAAAAVLEGTYAITASANVRQPLVIPWVKIAALGPMAVVVL